MNQKKLNPTVIGIDLGAFTTTIAAIQNGSVDVITNEANFRQTPSVVGYGEAERKIGETGNVKIKSNFKNTIVSPSRYLDFQETNKEEIQFCTCPYKYENGELTFAINYQNSKRQLKPQQVLASYFTQLKQIVSHNNLDPKQYVITVPPFFTQTERKAVLHSAEISNMKNVKIVNSSVAMGLDFGMFKKEEMKDHAKNVVFVDFGHSKMTVSLLKFSGSTVEVLAEKYDRNLGCRDIDLKIFESISQAFEEKTGLKIAQNKKAFLKVMETIQRQRKILSGIHETEISIECLMEDEDLCEALSREKMATVAGEIFNKIETLLAEFKEELAEKQLKVDMIELVGGGTRIPAIIELVKRVFEMQPSRTINSNETIARGAALYAVKKSGLFRFIDYSIKNKAIYPVRASWNFLNNAEEEFPATQNELLFDGSEVLPCEKVITLKTSQPVEILVSYDVLDEKIRKKFLYAKANNIKEETELLFRFEISEEGIVTLNRIEEKGVKKQFEVENFGILNQNEVKKFSEFEREMYIRDFEIIKSYEKKNELETVIYQQKERITNQDIANFLEPETVSKITEELEKLGNDLEEGNLTFTIKQYDENIKNLSLQMKSISEKAANKKAEVQQYYAELEKLKKFAEDHIEHICSRYRNSKKVSDVYENIKAILDWINDLVKISKDKKAYELPLVRPEQLEEKYRNIKEYMDHLQQPEPRQYYEEPQYYYQRSPQQEQRRRQASRHQQYDPFGMGRSMFGNGFFNNSFF